MASTGRPAHDRPAAPVSAVPGPRAARGPARTTDAAEQRLVAALRAGDETAFASLVDRLTPGLLRVAQAYVPSRAVAEEVVQETWLALLRGLDRFEERSSVKTWLFAVLANLARTRGARERRTDPVGLFADDADVPVPTVPARRFRPPESPVWPQHWLAAPRSWRDEPEQRLLARETMARVRAALEQLPPRQRAVVALRDVEGYDADEVCDLLGLTAVNQRVLLHRGRARIRAALEEHLG